MSNPFDQNPWQQEPRYGNAYQSEGNPTFGSNNAWAQESNKTEYTTNNNAWDPQPTHYQQTNNIQQQDAYQYSGTAYGNQNTRINAYSATPSQQQENGQPQHSNNNNNNNKQSVGPDPWNGQVYHTPNKWRFWFRFVLLLASIGHLGFAAGARPYSGQDVPFYTSACFYYLFAVAVLSIIWSAYHVFFYCYRRILKKPKTNRPIMIALDLLMAILWGIGVIVEVAKFRCTDGSKFCSFYNVSIFWGFLAFAGYIFSIFWDIYGACNNKRQK